MKLYSYIVTHDTGFSPNPFWGYCTLADCKPLIRKTAKIGDWIVGLSSKSLGNKIIYAMEVNEILTFFQYFHDERFQKKIPDYSKGAVVYKCGDNIYEPLLNGDYRQLKSMHSNNAQENPDTKKHDLGGKNVLISKIFYYFGSKAIELPAELYDLKVGRAHKNKFPSDVILKFKKFILDYSKGVHAPPTKWLNNDNSWKK